MSASFVVSLRAHGSRSQWSSSSLSASSRSSSSSSPLSPSSPSVNGRQWLSADCSSAGSSASVSLFFESESIWICGQAASPSFPSSPPSLSLRSSSEAEALTAAAPPSWGRPSETQCRSPETGRRGYGAEATGEGDEARKDGEERSGEERPQGEKRQVEDAGKGVVEPDLSFSSCTVKRAPSTRLAVHLFDSFLSRREDVVDNPTVPRTPLEDDAGRAPETKGSLSGRRVAGTEEADRISQDSQGDGRRQSSGDGDQMGTTENFEKRTVACLPSLLVWDGDVFGSPAFAWRRTKNQRRLLSSHQGKGNRAVEKPEKLEGTEKPEKLEQTEETEETEETEANREGGDCDGVPDIDELCSSLLVELHTKCRSDEEVLTLLESLTSCRRQPSETNANGEEDHEGEDRKGGGEKAIEKRERQRGDRTEEKHGTLWRLQRGDFQARFAMVFFSGHLRKLFFCRDKVGTRSLLCCSSLPSSSLDVAPSGGSLSMPSRETDDSALAVSAPPPSSSSSSTSSPFDPRSAASSASHWDERFFRRGGEGGERRRVSLVPRQGDAFPALLLSLSSSTCAVCPPWEEDESEENVAQIEGISERQKQHREHRSEAFTFVLPPGCSITTPLKTRTVHSSSSCSFSSSSSSSSSSSPVLRLSQGIEGRSSCDSATGAISESSAVRGLAGSASSAHSRVSTRREEVPVDGVRALSLDRILSLLDEFRHPRHTETRDDDWRRPAPNEDRRPPDMCESRAGLKHSYPCSSASSPSSSVFSPSSAVNSSSASPASSPASSAVSSSAPPTAASSCLESLGSPSGPDSPAGEAAEAEEAAEAAEAGESDEAFLSRLAQSVFSPTLSFLPWTRSPPLASPHLWCQVPGCAECRSRKVSSRGLQSRKSPTGDAEEAATEAALSSEALGVAQALLRELEKAVWRSCSPRGSRAPADARRVETMPEGKKAEAEGEKRGQETTGESEEDSLAILFSGGVDSSLLAALVLRLLSEGRLAPPPLEGGGGEGRERGEREDTRAPAGSRRKFVVELVNVAFTAAAPDRLTGLASYADLLQRWTNLEKMEQRSADLNRGCCDLDLRFVCVDVTEEEAVNAEEEILRLVAPHETHMDVNIASALYFAARGKGYLVSSSFYKEPEWKSLLESNVWEPLHLRSSPAPKMATAPVSHQIGTARGFPTSAATCSLASSSLSSSSSSPSASPGRSLSSPPSPASDSRSSPAAPAFLACQFCRMKAKAGCVHGACRLCCLKLLQLAQVEGEAALADARKLGEGVAVPATTAREKEQRPRKDGPNACEDGGERWPSCGDASDLEDPNARKPRSLHLGGRGWFSLPADLVLHQLCAVHRARPRKKQENETDGDKETPAAAGDRCTILAAAAGGKSEKATAVGRSDDAESREPQTRGGTGRSTFSADEKKRRDSLSPMDAPLPWYAACGDGGGGSLASTGKRPGAVFRMCTGDAFSGSALAASESRFCRATVRFVQHPAWCVWVGRGKILRSFVALLLLRAFLLHMATCKGSCMNVDAGEAARRSVQTLRSASRLVHFDVGILLMPCF
ncbi:asparagine synthase [Toxoplasma gondii MAS]|uniref:Asparagine synthase n=1 Tax=Toxoplasma gondii MAS TaxID=943118 RepID=A0A086QVK2_TOXGO|nr:asparagine synthase [Toxoplasma gondii MAS]